MVVYFVDIGGIFDHLCLNFLFIIKFKGYLAFNMIFFSFSVGKNVFFVVFFIVFMEQYLYSKYLNTLEYFWLQS